MLFSIYSLFISSAPILGSSSDLFHLHTAFPYANIGRLALILRFFFLLQYSHSSFLQSPQLSNFPALHCSLFSVFAQSISQLAYCPFASFLPLLLLFFFSPRFINFIFLSFIYHCPFSFSFPESCTPIQITFLNHTLVLNSFTVFSTFLLLSAKQCTTWSRYKHVDTLHSFPLNASFCSLPSAAVCLSGPSSRHPKNSHIHVTHPTSFFPLPVLKLALSFRRTLSLAFLYIHLF